MTTDYPSITRALTEALALARSPVAVCLTDSVPAGVPAFTGRVPAGCAFWQEAARGPFATSPGDHDLCGIGTFTHNLAASAAHEEDRRSALQVFAGLGYVRPEDIPLIPTLSERRRHVVYAPLADTPMPPDAVVLFVKASQTLVLVEAAEGVDHGAPPAMGRPACAVIPQVVNSGRAALSLGCCGARAYLDALSDDVALFAMPGGRLAEYTARVVELARANSVLGAFHRLRRSDVKAGGRPTVRESLARLGS
ncbi:MAG: DUF169 domain-containing protein [Candidatus Rokuibacteriota bacterium]